MLKKRIGLEEFENKITFMIFGYNLFPTEISGFDINDLAPIREFYNTYKEQILDKWRKQDRPGERPWAWWQLEAPEPLKVVETRTIPSIEFNYKNEHVVTKERTFDVKETQLQYLQRLNLLEPWEIEKLNV